MGSLKEMLGFLTDTRDELKEIEKKLDGMQKYFNDNFSNAHRIRNDEIEFLQKEFFSKPSQFPDEIDALYQKSIKTEETSFEKNLKDLEKNLKDKEKEMAEADEARLKFFSKVKRRNTRLDNREEKLKKRVKELAGDIDAYNKQIDELNTGFGFIANFFRMKKIQKKKEALINKRTEIVADIEDVRGKWTDAEKQYKDEEADIHDRWNNAQTELSILKEKIENLKKNKKLIVERAAFNSSLAKLTGEEAYLTRAVKTEKIEKCPRCKSENKTNKFFCNFCGERFSKDRKDVAGSLVEVGELNRVHADFMEGITGSVSFLALMKGILKGVNEFIKSVKSVKGSQDKYSQLPKLKIDVPSFTRSFAEKIKEINPKIDAKYYNLHPNDLAESVKLYSEKIFIKENIEKFFTGMGDELNKTTKEQWK